MTAAIAIILTLTSLTWADEWACVDYAKSPSELVHLETQATRGALPRRDLDCLETGYKNATVLTTKNKISRVLLVNAYAKDTELWAQLVLRHLEEVSKSDPNIAFLYAFHLYNTKSGDLEAIIEWADVGLQNKHEWKGNVHVSRVTSLLRLRALASNDLYVKMASNDLSSSGSQDALFDLRNQTKTYSRDWMDYAKASGRGYDEAFDLCLSVANEQACQGQAESPSQNTASE